MDTDFSIDYGADFGTRPAEGTTRYVTGGGITVTRTAAPFAIAELTGLVRRLDRRRGGSFSSGMEYPGRYSRWHTGYIDPCMEFTSRGRDFTATALNGRGSVLLPAVGRALTRAGSPTPPDGPGEHQITVRIPEPSEGMPEEERSRRPTVFSAIRQLIAAFSGPDEYLGLFGAFGYDLAFQFEPIRLRPGRDRAGDQRDLVLHLPDELFVVDRKRETAVRYSYDFETDGRSTSGLPRAAAPTSPAASGRRQSGASPRRAGSLADLPADPEPGTYAAVVERARERFAAGDLFEVVPSHRFWARCGSPAAFYERLRRHNPAPYEFFLNLGEEEYLVGASPEMYVRVSGDRVETCPISGTIARGADPLADAENIRTLLTSAKEESELTMCTDVDRNDKSRICVPGSIRVIGRRQIEMYSRLIHTVDHVEGRLRPGFDALDAFLTHMWAVTVTGAPKAWAMQFIEDHETSPRAWYGGAVGSLGFDGTMNTGLTLRTAHINGTIASVRTGATLLFDSQPDAEERETMLKARALLEVLRQADAGTERASAGQELEPQGLEPDAGTGRAPSAAANLNQLPGTGLRVLLVDHQDSFVHTLAGYFREQGAEVTTLRAGFAPTVLDEHRPDLVVLSPGPGRPADFGCSDLLTEIDRRAIASFGVCLGLQAMVEHAGGALSLLRRPAHGKPDTIRVTGDGLFAGLPAEFTAGRYHSLHATPAQIAGAFTVTALTADPNAAGGEVVMAIEDPRAARWAVQFHPESILTAADGAGRALIANVLRLCRDAAGPSR